MPIFKFRVSWQEDDNIQRDIEILSGQTFEDLHQSIIKSFLLNPAWHATFGVLNEVGKRVYSIDDTKLITGDVNETEKLYEDWDKYQLMIRAGILK